MGGHAHDRHPPGRARRKHVTGNDHGYRATIETVECFGAQIEIVDPGDLLTTAQGTARSVLHGGAYPVPIAGIDLLVSAGRTGDALAFHGTVRLARPRWVTPTMARELGAAVAPVAAALLLGPIRAPLAAATLGVAALRARQRQVAEEQPDDAEAGPATLASPEFGGDVPLSYGLTHNGSQRTVSTVVEVTQATVDDLVAFTRLLLDVARRVAGRPDDEAFLAGRSYTLGARGRGRPTDAPAGLDTLGGLDHLVGQLREVATSFQHPDVMKRWGARRPRGILLYGPPGTGKTTMAKALADEIGAAVREIRVPDILNKWVGGSEGNLKRVFTEARRVTSPTLLLFDEFESIISYTGQAMDAASQMNNALAGLFKQEMGTLVDENPNVLVVATTNFPERVDESLVRAGRFDLKLEVPMPDAPARADILRKILRKLVAEHETGEFRLLADDIDVQELADLSTGMSGADLDELVRRVQMAKAMADARGHGDVTPISQDDLQRAIAGMRAQGR
jgi:transitional endoplasmic reticulum ATPase